MLKLTPLLILLVGLLTACTYEELIAVDTAIITPGDAPTVQVLGFAGGCLVEVQHRVAQNEAQIHIDVYRVLERGEICPERGILIDETIALPPTYDPETDTVIVNGVIASRS